MLRHPLTASPIADFGPGIVFQPVIPGSVGIRAHGWILMIPHF